MFEQIKEFFGKMFSCFTPNVKEKATLKRDISCGELCCMGLSSTTASEILDYKEKTEVNAKRLLGAEKAQRQISPEAQKLRETLLKTNKKSKSNEIEMSR